MNNGNEKMTKTECFELREKRLKLVYKILYVTIAIWIATVLGISGTNFDAKIAPVYTFLLSSSSIFIIQIVKYALMEFRCMKVIEIENNQNDQNDDNTLPMQTEKRYDNIWKSFSLTLSLNALFMIFHIIWPIAFSPNVLIWIFGACVVYFLIFSIIEMFKKIKETASKVLDIINLFVGILTAYSICAFCCVVMIK